MTPPKLPERSRIKAPGRQRLTQRSYAFLTWIEFTQPTSRAALSIRFALSDQITNRECRKLEDLGGLIVRHGPYGAAGPRYFTLSAKGRRVLAERRGVETGNLRVVRAVRLPKLEHHDGVGLFVASLQAAADRAGRVELREVLLERDIRRRVEARDGRLPRGTVLADAAFRLQIRRAGQVAFALELDLSSESSSVVRGKALSYMGLLLDGVPLLETSRWFVLCVCRSRRRVHTLARAVAQVEGAEQMWWFSTASELTPASVLTDIWQRIELAGDGAIRLANGLPFSQAVMAERNNTHYGAGPENGNGFSGLAVTP